MSTTRGIHFHTGTNLLGYLPSTEPTCHLSHADAAAHVADLAREMADDFDAQEWEELRETFDPTAYPLDEDGEPDLGDDTPAERAAVDAALTDDPPTDGAHWATVVTDPRGWGHVAWLAVVQDDECDHEGCEHDPTDGDEFLVTFAPVDDPRALDGLAVMSLDQARRTVALGAQTMRTGRIVNLHTGDTVTD